HDVCHDVHPLASQIGPSRLWLEDHRPLPVPLPRLRHRDRCFYFLGWQHQALSRQPLTSSDDDIDFLSGNPRLLEFVDSLTREKVDEFLPGRCPDELRDQHDSGGGVTYIIGGCPSGLGEPCFDSLEALLAHAIMSIPAVRGRHDPNVAPRAVSIVEAMAALTNADALMAQHARQMGMKIRSWTMVH
ncbi:Chorismate synthase, partial [Colletotrichum viniferum]